MTIRPPLAGITVADFSRVLAGPLCTMMLADAGARVVKIEEPERGDETRGWGPPWAGEESAYFLSVNRNKESVALDLKSEEGRTTARRLIRRADVVIDNFLPLQRQRLGLTAPEVLAINPRAVCCSIVGYPCDSSQADTPGYDLLAQAAGGLMSITGEPEGTGMKTGVAISDLLTAHYAHGAILAALFDRERHGKGASIEVSLFEATVASLVNVAQNYLVTGKEPRRWGNSHASIVPYQAFRALDRSFAVGVGNDRQFELLCREVIAAPGLAADERFSTNTGRVEHREALVAKLEGIFATRPARHWVEECRRVSIPAAIVQNLREIFESDLGRAMVVSSPGAPSAAVRSPVRYNGSTLPVRSAAPSLGEHTEAVLRELEE